MTAYHGGKQRIGKEVASIIKEILKKLKMNKFGKEDVYKTF